MGRFQRSRIECVAYFKWEFELFCETAVPTASIISFCEKSINLIWQSSLLLITCFCCVAAYLHVRITLRTASDVWESKMNWFPMEMRPFPRLEANIPNPKVECRAWPVFDPRQSNQLLSIKLQITSNSFISLMHGFVLPFQLLHCKWSS